MREAIDLIVTPDGIARWQDHTFRCALGKGGVVPAAQKCEGDGATPFGAWVMRELFYRADRLAQPVTGLPCRAIAEQDGWCDAATDARYNLPVQHPYPASAEHLWRADEVYDLIVPLGYNDDPVVAGKGSAIFMHVARENYAPTAGCVVLKREDLLVILQGATPQSVVRIVPSLG